MVAIQPSDVVVRLFLTVAAGFLIGFNRGGHGRPAGIRTTILVCLAASIAMIQANLLLGTSGKTAGSFVTMDIMRFPLGILTGVGFIGAGTILRRHDLVIGVTTAATLWFVTVIGLCFGGGQIGLGIAGTALGLAVLWGLHILEMRIHQDRSALLTIKANAKGPESGELRNAIEAAGLEITKLRESFDNRDDGLRTMHFTVRWRGLREDPSVPAAVSQTASRPGIVELDWAPLN